MTKMTIEGFHEFMKQCEMHPDKADAREITLGLILVAQQIADLTKTIKENNKPLDIDALALKLTRNMNEQLE